MPQEKRHPGTSGFPKDLLDWIDTLDEDTATDILVWLARNRPTALGEARYAITGYVYRPPVAGTGRARIDVVLICGHDGWIYEGEENVLTAWCAICCTMEEFTIPTKENSV
jgi:hypothetical protein